MRPVAVILVALLLLSAGCDRLFWTGLSPASTPDRPVFLFGGQPDLSGDAWVYGVEVSGRPRHENQWHSFWKIEKDSAVRYVVVHEVPYGSVPEHMSEAAVPESLPSGYVYSMSAGFHGLGRPTYFEITADIAGARSISELSEDEFARMVHDTL